MSNRSNWGFKECIEVLDGVGSTLNYKSKYMGPGINDDVKLLIQATAQLKVLVNNLEAGNHALVKTRDIAIPLRDMMALGGQINDEKKRQEGGSVLLK